MRKKEEEIMTRVDEYINEDDGNQRVQFEVRMDQPRDEM